MQPDLGWHGARMMFLAPFLVALFRVKSVNFSELATGFMGSAKMDSNYKRLQRFFSEFELDYHRIARLVAHLMGVPQPWILSIDRTNWEFGDQVFNILILGVVHNGVAFPLLWLMLDKKGNSNSGERIDLLNEFFEVFPEVEVAYLTGDRDLLNEFFEVFPEVEVAYLTGDREFLGQVWFEYLLEKAQLEFRIRIRESDKLDDGCQSLKAKVVFSALPSINSKYSVIVAKFGGTGFIFLHSDSKMGNC